MHNTNTHSHTHTRVHTYTAPQNTTRHDLATSTPLSTSPCVRLAVTLRCVGVVRDSSHALAGPCRDATVSAFNGASKTYHHETRHVGLNVRARFPCYPLHRVRNVVLERLDVRALTLALAVAWSHNQGDALTVSTQAGRITGNPAGSHYPGGPCRIRCSHARSTLRRRGRSCTQ